MNAFRRMMLRAWSVCGRGMTAVMLTLAIWSPIAPMTMNEAVGATAADVVTYREWPEGGSFKESGRTLQAEEHARYGIDVNSHVDIEVDSALLKRKLADKVPGGLSPEAQKLQARILQLEETSHQIDRAMKKLQQAFNDFNSAKEDPRLWDQAKNSIQEFSSQMKSIIDPLRKAMELRLQVAGTARTEQDKKSEIDAKIVSVDIADGTYNWKLLVQLYEQELTALDKAMGELAPQLDRLQMEIQGHIFRAGNPQGEPISLPRYNTVKECVPTPLPKVTFNIPSDQLKLYEDYSKIAQNMADAKSGADAIRMSLAIEAKRIQASLDESFAPTGAAVKQARQSIESLSFWADQDNAEGWFNKVTDKAGTSEEGKKIVAAYLTFQSDLVALYDEAKFDLDVMARYAELRSAIANQAPEQTMITILEEIKKFAQARTAGKAYLLLPEALRPSTWRARIVKAEQLVKMVKESAPEIAKQLEGENYKGRNPIKDVQSAADAFNKAAMEIDKVSGEIPAWLAQVLQLPPVIAAGELPRPESQERFSIVKGELGTSFDLQAICGPRSEYDQIRISYSFFSNDTELAAGWHNDFQLRKYGWKDSVIASISFTRQRSTNTYKPTASLSWILDKTWWPKASDKGVGVKNGIEWFSGFGLTSMALDFDPTQDTELGLGGTLSFLSNKVLVGYGWDLQAKEKKGFAFFSINLFQTSGIFPANSTQRQ